MRKYLTIILFFLSISVFCQESNKKEEKCFVNSIEEAVNKELEYVRNLNRISNDNVFILYEYKTDLAKLQLNKNEYIKENDFERLRIGTDTSYIYQRK